MNRNTRRASRQQELDRGLTLLYSSGSAFLDEYAWEWEQDRWGELLIAVLIEAERMTPTTARAVVQTLSELRLTDARTLASLDAGNGGDIVARLIERAGVETSRVESVVKLLVSVAKTVEAREGGKVQRLLRRHGEAMKAELAGMLTSSGVQGYAAEHAATLWLQNTCNIPILARRDRHVKEFLRAVGVTEAELIDSADRLDVNLSILDDLLALSATRDTAEVKKERPSGRGRRRRA